MPPLMPGRFFGPDPQLPRLRFLLISAFILCSFITATSQEQMSREVKVKVFNLDCISQKGSQELAAAQNYQGWVVKFGQQSIVMDSKGEATVVLTYLKDTGAGYNVARQFSELPLANESGLGFK